MSYQRDVNSGASIAGGVLGLIGGATIGAIGLMVQASDERKRQQAAEELKKTILKEQPPELADILLNGFANSNYSPTYDFTGIAKRYHRQKLYRYLVLNVSEQFADAYFAREAKFENFGLQFKASEIFERTAAETKVDIGSGEQLLQKFGDALKAEAEPYLQNARWNGGTPASNHHDGLPQMRAEKPANAASSGLKSMLWDFGKGG